MRVEVDDGPRVSRNSEWACGFLLVAVACSSVRADRIIYVNASAVSGSTGASWEDAYSDLQDALDDVRSFGGCPCQLWIAEGTYSPDRGTLDRTLSFELPDGAELFGGFGGWETCLDQRDPAVYLTILSGDLLGNDAGHPTPTSSCCTITYQPGCDDAGCAEIANANDPTDIKCETWWDLTCMVLARELCCDLCRPGRCDNAYTVLRATGLSLTTILDGVTVSGSEANGIDHQYAEGGGLSIHDADVTIVDAMFTNNLAVRGAAIHLDTGSVRVSKSMFTDNVSHSDGSNAVYAKLGDVTVRDCLFSGNLGGAVHVREGSLLVHQSRFVENVSPGIDAAGITLDFMADANITDCVFADNRGTSLSNEGIARIVDSQFITNAGAISNCGALYLTNSLLVGNTAGGVTYYPYQTPGYGIGGALDNFCGGAAILNCTIVGNHAQSAGGVWGGVGVAIRNSILWGNTDEQNTIESAQVSAYDENDIEIDHSIVAGWTGDLGGIGNRGSNPRFIDVDGPDNLVGTEDDDVHLLPDSAAIGTGNPDTIGLPLTDLDGHARVLCGQVDIGAYEFGIGDYDCNRTIDLTDFASWQTCMTGPTSSSLRRSVAEPVPIESGSLRRFASQSAIGCEAFDYNADNDIDLADLQQFLNHVQP